MSYKQNAFNINQNRNALHDYVKSDWSLGISNDDVVKSQACLFLYIYHWLNRD